MKSLVQKQVKLTQWSALWICPARLVIKIRACAFWIRPKNYVEAAISQKGVAAFFL